MNNLEVKKSDKVEDKSYFKIFLMCILYGKIRFFNFRIAAGITVLLLILLAGTSGASPPPAILIINGNEQTSGIGSSCWKVENETYSLCLDTVGIITPTEPLPARSPFTAHLSLPIQESPDEAGFSATRVTDDDELKEVGNNVRAWRFKGKAGNWNNLPKEPEPDINLSLEKTSGFEVFLAKLSLFSDRKYLSKTFADPIITGTIRSEYDRSYFFNINELIIL